MHDAQRYCETRNSLEQRCWDLTSRLFNESSHLLTLIGRPDKAFATAKRDCEDTRAEIHDARVRLDAHCFDHGC